MLLSTLGSILVLIGGLVGAPRAADAQPGDKVYRIGVLAVAPAPAIDGLRQGMAELGYREGRNVRYEYRWAEGHDERMPALAADLARLKVDVIVTWGTPAALAARHATSTIPIVLGAIGDPVGIGLVPSFARPGGNVTGFTSLASALEEKRLEILKQIVPNAARVAVVWNSLNPAVVAVSLKHVQAAAADTKVKIELVDAHDVSGLESAFEAIKRRRPHALMVLADPFLVTERRRIAEFATAARLPSIANYREYPEAGGLLSYGPSYPDLFRRAAGYVDRIFKGARPGDLPIQEPTKFELVVNVKAAKTLGITIPPAVLLRADHVVE